MNDLNTKDISESSYNSLRFGSNKNWWSSTQYDAASGWYMGYFGRTNMGTKTITYYTCPVLEIPNN